MTVREARQRLLEYFFEHDEFSFKEHGHCVLPVEDIVGKTRGAFEVALRQFRKQNLVEYAHRQDVWVLLQPLVEYPQTVVVSGEAASLITDVVNGLVEESVVPGPVANPLCVTEADLVRLALAMKKVVESQQRETRQPLGFAA